jgi:hypothetical protein
MNKLPNEIFIYILDPLDFTDKLQCILTCRNWYTQIVNTVLYSKIHFERGQDNSRTIKAIRTLQRKRVEYQILDLRISYVSDPMELSRFCPNLKSLEIVNWSCDQWNDKRNASMAQNWKKLEAIKETNSHYLVTMKLLDSSTYLMSLTSIFINFGRQSKEQLPIFIKQLKYAPALEKLALKHVPRLIFDCMDLLHQCSLNLKHLRLEGIYSSYVYSDDLEGIPPLPICSSVSSKLLSFAVDFDIRGTPMNETSEVNYSPWIEYISRKYTNLISIRLNSINMFKSLHNNDTAAKDLQKALPGWTRLHTFDIRSVYLSADILQAMDDCNIRLKELKVYIDFETDMEQLLNLAHSQQSKAIKKLIIYDKFEGWSDQMQLVYLLRSLSTSTHQLKAIDIRPVIKKRRIFRPTLTMPIQLLNYLPCLQRLAMRLYVEDDFFLPTYRQTTHLTQLNLEICLYLSEIKRHSSKVQQHIQELIYASPLLQTFSIIFYRRDVRFTLDFQKNTVLRCVEYTVPNNKIIKVIQHNQTKWYTFYMLPTDYQEEQRYGLREVPQNDSHECNITLILPPSVRSLCSYNKEYPFSKKRYLF